MRVMGEYVNILEGSIPSTLTIIIKGDANMKLNKIFEFEINIIRSCLDDYINDYADNDNEEDNITRIHQINLILEPIEDSMDTKDFIILLNKDNINFISLIMMEYASLDEDVDDLICKLQKI